MSIRKKSKRCSTATSRNRIPVVARPAAPIAKQSRAAQLAMTVESKHSFPPERFAVATLRERPELGGQMFSAEIQAGWPEFARHDPVAALYYGALDRYVDFVLAGVD